MKISLVVLTYNHWELTHQLLMDIKQHCQGVDEVLVVNNGSDDLDVYDGLKFWKKLKIFPIKVLHIQENCGFVRGANRGLKSASGDLIILFSNDVRIVNRHFMDDVRSFAALEIRSLFGGKLYTTDTGWNRFGDVIVPYIEGWCVGAFRQDWKTLQYFDDRYGLSDFEDVDLSMMAVRLGFELMELNLGRSLVHLGARTFGYNPEREERTKHNRRLFARKWGLKE